MIYKNIELHNVEQVHDAAGGIRLQRVPDDVREGINEAAQMRVREPDNCEVRFVCESGEAEVVLSSEGRAGAAVWYGTFDGRDRYLLGREPTAVRLVPQPYLDGLSGAALDEQQFSPKVCRVVFGGRNREPVILHEVRGKGIRPPRSGEVPSLRYLAYGTSITHGFDCEGPHLSYVGQTAWRLKADLINLGVGGACHCEKAIADYIAGRKDWDMASLALSVNMQGFPLDEFRSRVAYMVNTVSGADTGRPVACVTLYPYRRDLGISDPQGTFGGTPEEYRQALRDVVKACPHPNAHLVEGPEILTNIGGLTSDLVHPSDNGMIEMGRNLAERLKKLL